MNEEKTNRILARDSWFAGLPLALADEILRLARPLRVRNALLYRTGDEPNGLFGLLSGEVHVSHTAPDGKVGILIVNRPGAWIGETSVMDGLPRNLDAFAIGSCELLHLSMGAFTRLVEETPAYYKSFGTLLCSHYRLALMHIVSSRELPVVSRLAQRVLLYSVAQSERGKPTNLVRLSQAQLASVVGVSRQALSAHLKNLEHQSIISLGYKTLRILKRGSLEQLAKQSG
jgi:CRP-like cAMP-binding protein